VNQFEEALLKYLSADDLTKLQEFKIGIAGAGGLGSNAAGMLVRTGFKQFKIVDFDVVEPSNLNRQFYFWPQLGQKKVEALKENLRLINPDVHIEAVAERIEAQNIEAMFADCHIVVEAFDKPEYKKMPV
jgi:sulfur carrier protein ThiS adenylyltransferase